MKTYQIPIQELIKVWQNCIVTIETDDSIEEVYKHIKNGDFMSHYDCDDIEALDIMFETCDTLDWDYSNTKMQDIEEII